MDHRTFKAGLLALAIVLPGAAFANEPSPGSTESYSGSLAELATGVRSTPPQPTTIQSPRDAASGQATGVREGGQSIKRKPPRNKNRKGKRMHKPA